MVLNTEYLNNQNIFGQESNIVLWRAVAAAANIIMSAAKAAFNVNMLVWEIHSLFLPLT